MIGENEFVFKYANHIPHCKFLKKERIILKFISTQPDTYKQKYILLGCGEHLICIDCGIAYSKRFYYPLVNLTETLFLAFPKLEIAHIVLTIPRNYPNLTESPKSTVTKLFKLARTFLNRFFPDTGGLIVYHNWSSKHPEFFHPHFHCIIFGLKTSKTLTHFYYEVSQLREFWSKLLNLSTQTDIYIQYFYQRHLRKIKFLYRYVTRSPILDYTKTKNPILSSAFLRLVYQLKKFTRFRYFGWMVPSKKHKFLLSIGIKEYHYHRIKQWSFAGFYKAYYLEDEDAWWTDDDNLIPNKILLDMRLLIPYHIYVLNGG